MESVNFVPTVDEADAAIHEIDMIPGISGIEADLMLAGFDRFLSSMRDDSIAASVTAELHALGKPGEVQTAGAVSGDMRGCQGDIGSHYYRC
jgi:hypothetical protein